MIFLTNAGLIYGIGHAIYTKSDPRCQVIKKACKELAQEKGELEKYNCLCAFEKAALYQMRKQKHIETCANVDFYSGFAYSMLGIDKALYTPLFGMRRTAGWVATTWKIDKTIEIDSSGKCLCRKKKEDRCRQLLFLEVTESDRKSPMLS